MANKLIKMKASDLDKQLWFGYAGANEEFLKHYGVLGMKWGVRKDRQLTGGGVIKKGTKVSRLSTSMSEKHEGSTYGIAMTKQASAPKKELYFISNWLKRNPNSQLYRMDMKTNVDLILPSMKEKGETFVNEILKNPKITKQIITASDKFLGEDRQNTEFAKGREEALKKAKKLKTIDIDTTKTGIDAIKDPDLKKAYITFAQALNDKEIRGGYISALQKKRFSATSDDLMDQDIKALCFNNRDAIKSSRVVGGVSIGGALGSLAGLPVTILSGGVIPPPAVMAGGMLIGGLLGRAMANEKFLPNDRNAYGTASIIIFDRGETLEVIKTKRFGGVG